MNDNQVGGKQKLPYFHLEARYPNAYNFLNTPITDTKSFVDEAIFVLDTNILLFPYKTSKENFNQIQKVYTKLIAENRLFIPEQSLREYINNKLSVIEGMYNSIGSSKDKITNLEFKGFPLIKSLPKHEELNILQIDINEKIKKYREIIGNILREIESWNHNDPVSEVYRKLFKENIIINSGISNEKIEADFKRRSFNKIPPGYSDLKKPDSGIGDVIIWLTILELGRKHNKNLIFVTAEKKEDWWELFNKKPISPRLELINEYRDCSDGHTFAIWELSELLENFGTPESTVEEIKNDEQLLIDNKLNAGSDGIMRSINAAIEHWLIQTVLPIYITYYSLDDVDFVLTFSNKKNLVGKVRKSSNISILNFLMDLSDKSKEVLKNIGMEYYIVIINAENKAQARSLSNQVSHQKFPKHFNFAIGYIDDEIFKSEYFYFSVDFAASEWIYEKE